jgi:hypothetical protein
MICVHLPIRTVNSTNERCHWSVKSKRAKAERFAANGILCSRPRPALPCVITLTREGSRDMDGDGLQASFKAIRDGVADWLGIDDGDPRIDWRYRQKRSKGYGVIIMVEGAK